MRSFLRLLALVAAIAVLAQAAAAGERERAAAIDAYLEQSPPLEGRSVAAAATGGPLGWLIPQLYAWFPTLDGDMASGGTAVDFDSDLGLGDNEVTVMPVIQVSAGGVGIRFSAFFVEFEGDQTVSAAFDFGGVTFTLNERVQSRLEIKNYRLVTVFPIAKTDFLALNLQGGISVFQLDGRVIGETTGAASDSLDIPIPVAGLLAQAKVGRFLLEVDLVALTIDFGGVSGTLLDLEVSVGVTFLEIVGARAGYRIITLDGDSGGFDVDATLDGFFVGASLQF